ncbi:MAG: MmcQ/YjbR family DNA-binding protein [Candidatus Acidiferrales bacterium]
MTGRDFRRLALSFPASIEKAHLGHPDFRVAGRIFATLGYPDPRWAMVKLTPEQQAEFVAADPAIFVPVKGGWGRRGATNVKLRAAKAASVRSALAAAWCNTAPKHLAKEFEANLRSAPTVTEAE